MTDTPAATRHWVRRKLKAGAEPDDLRDKLRDDGDDPGIVDAVLDARSDLQDPADRSLTGGYRDAVTGMFGVDETYLMRLPTQPYPRLVGYAAVNSLGLTWVAWLGAILLAAMTGTFYLAAGGTLVVAAAVPLLFAAWTGLVAHGLLALFGVRDLHTTLKLYLALTVFYLVLWIPWLNLFLIPYGAMVTERSLEALYGLDFYRALFVTVAAPVAAAAIPLLLATPLLL